MTLRFIQFLFASALFLSPAGARAQDQRPFVRGSFAAIKAEHAGKPLIVHLWSMTCPPCLTELPLWGKIAAAHPGLVVLVEADPPADKPEPRVAARLAAAGLGSVESFAFADRFQDRLRFEIDPAWQGELPRTVLIAADGTSTAITGPMDETSIARWLNVQRR